MVELFQTVVAACFCGAVTIAMIVVADVIGGESDDL